MGELATELQTAMDALNASFHASLIATPKTELVCVPHDAPAEEWLATAPADFDQFPVQENKSIVGILYRDFVRSKGTAECAMFPLTEGVVVSANMPIVELISELAGLKARLILSGAEVNGLVTPSDLLKLPVRLCVFSVITHLEQVMAAVIKCYWKDDEWLKELSKGRQRGIMKKRKELEDRQMNPPLLELTEFADKRDLCRRLLKEGKNKFSRELDDARDLRDQLAHASTFIDSSKGHKGVNDFINTFERGTRWIEKLRELMVTPRAAK